MPFGFSDSVDYILPNCLNNFIYSFSGMPQPESYTEISKNFSYLISVLESTSSKFCFFCKSRPKTLIFPPSFVNLTAFVNKFKVIC